MSNTISKHQHNVIDSDILFRVDPFTRDIISEEAQKDVLMQGDHNSERFTFEIPRYIEGHDMWYCDLLQVAFLNIEAGRNPKHISGVYTVEDVRLNEKGDTILGSWLISGNATKYIGKLHFMLVFKCLTDVKLDYRWNSNIYREISVLESLNSDLDFELEHIDVIEQWKEAVMNELNAFVDEQTTKKVGVAKAELSEDLNNKFNVRSEEIDNVLESFDDILRTEITSMDEEIEVLDARMNTFTSLPDGSTSGDAELADIRVGEDGTIYPSAGAAVREQHKQVLSLIDSPSLYNLDVVKKHMALKEVYSGSITFNHVDDAKLWQYKTVEVALPAGNYIAIIRGLDVDKVGYFSICEDATHIPFLNVTEDGTYGFTVWDNGYSTEDNMRTLKLQVCEGEAALPGTYSIGGITIFEDNTTDAQAFPDEFIGLNKVVKKQIGNNIVDPAGIIEGYYIDGGGRLTEANPEYEQQYASGYIPIESGATYAFYDKNIGGACVAFYDSVLSCVLAINNSSTEQRIEELNGIITAPESAKYLRISGRAVNKHIAMVSKSDVQIPFEPYTEYKPLLDMNQRLDSIEDYIKNRPLKKYAGFETMNANTILSLDTDTHTKWGYTIGFDCAITDEFKGIIISRGKTEPYCSAYVKIDAKNVTVYKYTSKEEVVKTIPHQLTFGDFLYCTIHTYDDNTARLIITANESATVDIEWNASKGPIAVEALSTLSKCNLVYSVPQMLEDLWIFGDSYFDMWPRYVTSWGFNKFLEDAHSGRGSKAAIASLKEYLLYSKPKRIVWFMGMNDPDKGSINSIFEECISELFEICYEEDIGLVLSTVPNTPTNDNSYKNAWIKSIAQATGVPILDICHAVGADTTTSWHQGLLSGDNVHPSPKGRIVIANYILNNLPEITKQ